MKCLSKTRVKRQKGSNDRTENGLFTNATNCKSRAGLSTPFYTDISFLADCLNIFTQDFATQLPYVAFRFSWQTLQTSLQLFSFLGRPLFAFSILERSSNLISAFSRAKNKNKKYEDPFAPTEQRRLLSDWLIYYPGTQALTKRAQSKS